MECGNLYAQKAGQALVDSLEKQLEIGKFSENDKVDIMTNLCSEYREILPSKGIEYGLKAEKLAQKINYNKKLGEIYIYLSGCFHFYNDIIKSYEYSLEAVKYSVKYKNDNVLLISEIVSCFTNPNITNEKQKAVLDASLLKLNICTDKIWYIKTIGLLGSFYVGTGELDRGDSLIHIALNEAKKINQQFLVYLNHSRIAEIFSYKKEYDSAIHLLVYVDAYLVSIGDQSLRCENENELAAWFLESYKLKQDILKITEAKTHIILSQEIAKKIGYSALELANYDTWKDIEKKEGNMDSAYFYLQKYVALYDSLYGQNARARTEKITISQRDEIAAREMKIKDVELQKQKVIIYSSIALALLFSVSSVMIYRNYKKQKNTNGLLSNEKQKSESLLLNILPSEVAEELKEKGVADAKHFDNVTVIFTDFVNFTDAGERMSPKQLVEELHTCFKAFDGIIGKYNIEKIKTIGDAYFAVSGLPVPNPNHASDIVAAAIEIRDFMLQRKKQFGDATFGIRVGINSGNVVAGIVGVKKFDYDIWGYTVNTAARMEQNSETGKINISQTTYDLVKDKFTCAYRGEIDAKNKGKLKMYFVDPIVLCN